MGILTIEDAESQVEVVCYPRQWPSVKPMLTKGAPYRIIGTIRSEGKISLLLDDIDPLPAIREKGADALRIMAETDELPDDFYSSLQAELRKFPGEMPVLLDLQTPDAQVLLKIRTVGVSMDPDLAEKISSISHGQARVVF